MLRTGSWNFCLFIFYWSVSHYLLISQGTKHIMKPLDQENGILREKFAKVQHDIWISWMIHLFKVSIQNDDGTYTIPVEKVERWKRQIATSYDELSERERDGDREQVDKVNDILSRNDH